VVQNKETDQRTEDLEGPEPKREFNKLWSPQGGLSPSCEIWRGEKREGEQLVIGGGVDRLPGEGTLEKPKIIFITPKKKKRDPEIKGKKKKRRGGGGTPGKISGNPTKLGEHALNLGWFHWEKKGGKLQGSKKTQKKEGTRSKPEEIEKRRPREKEQEM